MSCKYLPPFSSQEITADPTQGNEEKSLEFHQEGKEQTEKSRLQLSIF